MASHHPLEVEVVAHVLGSLDHCSHCQVFIDGTGVGGQIHQADMESYPADWMLEWQQLSDLIFNLTERFANQLVIKITDARSPQALWMALRSGVRKYPTFIIANEKYHGYNEEQVASIIKRHLDINT
ncbi:MAG: hypothetical protein JSV61_09205 [Anaerolineales bacterium]|nr:MAG: hypothetical protein JSV61_09205 [Anaerolineales bacterium]